jgi:hypothetical protein
MKRILLVLFMILGLTLGIAASASAHYTGVDHWHYWPGYRSAGWISDCAIYAPDLGYGDNGANCHYKDKVCAYYGNGQYKWAQYVDVYYPNGDKAFNRGPAWNGAAC